MALALRVLLYARVRNAQSRREPQTKCDQSAATHAPPALTLPIPKLYDMIQCAFASAPLRGACGAGDLNCGHGKWGRCGVDAAGLVKKKNNMSIQRPDGCTAGI